MNNKTHQFLENGFIGKNSIWRFLLMILIIVLGSQLIGNIPFGTVSTLFAQKNGVPLSQENMLDFKSYGMNSNLGLSLLIFAFAIGLLLFAITIKPIHKRTLKQTVTGKKKFRWNRVFFGMMLWGTITFVTTGASILVDPENFTFRFDPLQFFILVGVVLVFLPLQTTFEEVLFRGYFTQITGVISKNRWASLLIPSVLFAAMHLANPEVKEYGIALTMPLYFGLGLLFAIVTLLDDGAELAIGMHAINNMLAALMVTSKASALQTDALFVQNNLVLRPVDILVMYIFIGLALWICYKKFNFDFSILNKPIENPKINDIILSE